MVRIVAERYAEIANTRKVGGQAEVLRASDLHHEGRTVAVKLIPAVRDSIHEVFFHRETSALRKLDHPNVARLLDSGLDESLSSFYVVLDWIPRTIRDWVGERDETPGWDDLADVVALPLSAALAHSHANSVLHRDIKPSNVLWDSNGPVLADFGLSKIKTQVAGTSDATVVDLASTPWAPPDQRSRGSSRFDVYGLGATLLQCLVDFELTDYPDIARALDDIDVPPPVFDLLRRSVAPDPDQRPADARVFDLELRRIQRTRSRKWHEPSTVTFELKPAAQRAIEDAVPGVSAEDAIEARLGDATYVLPRLRKIREKSSLVSDEFRLIGDQVELHLVYTTEFKLVCVQAAIVEFEDLERWRRDDDSVLLDGLDFTWSPRPPINPAASAKAAKELRAILQQAVQDSGDRASFRYQQARLNSWSQLIDAKEKLEQKLEEPIAYSVISESGSEYTLEAALDVTSAVLDQERVARSTDQQGPRGVPVNIVDIGDRTVVVRSVIPGSAPPDFGVLVRDRNASRAAIQRQKRALGALREGDAARPHLREIVLDPSSARVPDPVDFAPINPDLDNDKKVAVANALGASDVFLVEGPPGTGKTSFICELVNQHLRVRPHDKVLLVSQMHVAIDNAITRLHDSGTTSVVRLSNRDDKVEPDAAHLLLSNKLTAWINDIRERAQSGIAELASRSGVQVPPLQLALLIEESLAAARQRETRAAQLGTITPDDRLDNDDLDDERAELLADYLRADDRATESANSWKELANTLGVEVPEQPTPDDLDALVASLVGAGPETARIRALLTTQGDWLASLNDPTNAEPIFFPTQSVIAGTCMGFLGNRNVQDMQFDLCIIDEASRATAPELLVPMVRSRRWVMVGDTKQLPPMQEDVFDHPDLIEMFDLDKVFLSSSLFDTLLGEAPQTCKSRLVTQHRMATPIGELVSRTFYDGELVHEPYPALDPATVPAADRMVWFSTSRLPNRTEEKKAAGGSIANRCEVDVVCRQLEGLARAVAAGAYRRLDGARLNVLVLTGYTRQRTHIERALRSIDLMGLEVQVKTIDAVQGREADVVIFSVTRSNKHRDLGFLASRHEGRVNVALSRAREVLWVVGDAGFCLENTGPLQRVATHVRQSPDCRLEPL